MNKATAKAKAASRASRPRSAPARSKSQPKAGAKAKPVVAKRATGAKPATKKLGDWRAETLAEVRRLVRAADPRIGEEIKWIKPSNPAGVPVWSHAGIVCTGETYKQVVKLTFARGAALDDPRGLFNSSLEGNTRRAIDIREGESLDAEAFTALIRAAVAANLGAGDGKSNPTAKPKPTEKSSVKAKRSADATPGAKTRPAAKAAKAIKAAKTVKVSKGEQTVLLSGGNPQVAKADGNAPVRAYIAAMPGWKREIGQRLDGLVERNVPGVRKAVKWNSPFYGVAGQGWFLAFHVFTRYVKVTFFRGTSLQPVPPGGTGKDARWIDIHENDFDEARLADWVRQAAALPGWLA